MAVQFWNDRYAGNEDVYGTAPNNFFKQFIDTHKPGTILLPAEGEGRNAIYAAQKGWKVSAFDFSEVAKEKALKRDAAASVDIQYEISTIESFVADKPYDAVGLIYVHIAPAFRKKFHQEIIKSIKPGGYLVLEAFAKEQVVLSSGGPKDEALLYDAPTLCADFRSLHILNCEQKTLTLEEGRFHNCAAAVLRLSGQRI